jgi:hypothetical protein
VKNGLVRGIKPNAFNVGIRQGPVRAVNYRLNPLLKRVELMPKGLKLRDASL